MKDRDIYKVGRHAIEYEDVLPGQSQREGSIIEATRCPRSARASLSNTMMSIPVNGGESYPGHDFSISQLLYATKRKLSCSIFGGRYVPNHSRHLSRRTKSRIPQDFDIHESNPGEVEMALKAVGTGASSLCVSCCYYRLTLSNGMHWKCFAWFGP